MTTGGAGWDGDARWEGTGVLDAGPDGAAPVDSGAAVVNRRVERVDASGRHERDDRLAVEEPLEIRLEGRPAAVTMRTPGHDLDLVAGFLLTEGVIDGADDIMAMAHVDDPRDLQGNTVDVRLSPGVPAGRRQRAMRELFASSSCGICGKASIDRVMLQAPPIAQPLVPDDGVLLGLVATMRTAQAAFSVTGGLHAAALFTPDGQLEVLREDVGRHNAVDKVLGWRLRQDRVPVVDRILLVSGRAGFELVQKAWMAGVPVLAAVGAPSSLAAELAAQAGLTLIGFLRDGRFNRYC